MKATGIVRRIDELGRVVIPKEIRRAFHIRVGDALEIYTDNDGDVIFKMFSPVGDLGKYAKDYTDALSKATDKIVIVCDRDKCIAASGNKKASFINRPVAGGLDDIVGQRQFYEYNEGDSYSNALDGVESFIVAAAPIISAGDILGAVALISPESSGKCTKTEKELLTVAASFFAGLLSE